MAKVNKKTETPEVETPEVTPEATEAPATVADVLGAITDLSELEAKYKELKKEIKGKTATENKVAAIDLVSDAADELVDVLLSQVEERGMKFTNFTVRYVAKNDTGKGYADSRGISTVIGAVRMTQDEITARDEFNAAEYANLLAGTVNEKLDDESRQENTDDLATWIEDHSSFVVPSDEVEDTVGNG